MKPQRDSKGRFLPNNNMHSMNADEVHKILDSMIEKVHPECNNGTPQIFMSRLLAMHGLHKDWLQRVVEAFNGPTEKHPARQDVPEIIDKVKWIRALLEGNLMHEGAYNVRNASIIQMALSNYHDISKLEKQDVNMKSEVVINMNEWD